MKKQLLDSFGSSPEVRAALGALPDAPATYWTRFTEGYRYVDNIRRAMMTSQLATITRNIISQSGRYAINTLDDAMSLAAGAVTGKIGKGQAIDLLWEDFAAPLRAMTPANRAQLSGILSKFPDESARFFNTPIGDVNMGQKIAAFVNTGNAIQERFFRFAAFDARLRQNLSLRGASIMEGSKIGLADVVDAVDHALTLTFANRPKSGVGKVILSAYKEFPFLTALGNPFPRFWLNAMRFMYEFSPVPMLRGSTYAAMASADPRIAYGAISRSLIGTSMLGAGMALDRADYTGEKWYQVKIGDKNFDLRPFAPLSGMLFIGKMISRMAEMGEDAFLQITPDEWVNAFFALKRNDVIGLPLADFVFNTRNLDSFKDRIVSMLGGYMGGFTVPFRTITDFMATGRAELFKDETGLLPRTTRENLLFGQLMINVPFLHETLPVSPSPFRAEVRKDDPLQPLLKQLTGLIFKKETPVETEANRLGLKPQNIYPRTGNKEFDRIITNRMGGIAEEVLTTLMRTDFYRQSSFRVQREFFIRFLGMAKKAGKDIARADRPDLALEEFYRKSSEVIKETLDDAGGIDALIGGFQSLPYPPKAPAKERKHEKGNKPVHSDSDKRSSAGESREPGTRQKRETPERSSTEQKKPVENQPRTSPKPEPQESRSRPRTLREARRRLRRPAQAAAALTIIEQDEARERRIREGLG